MSEKYQLFCGDALTVMRSLPDAIVDTCVTSPPYFGLRDYGMPGQIGREETPELFISRLVEVFREVRRVLKDDGTCWINIADSYSAGGNGTSPRYEKMRGIATAKAQALPAKKTEGIAPKNLIGIPWMLAFALRADGWYLRSDIIWAKPNPMPESVTDRPTKAHEYLFLLSKSDRYYYDAAAIAEPTVTRAGFEGSAKGYAPGDRNDAGRSDYGHKEQGLRNKRSVWSVQEPLYQMRSDLTPEQRAYVLKRLSSLEGN